jgi:alanine-glyoxylate transaminase / serine-glyoxylate transaminase / serine-pyruvate transaminase
MGAGPTNTPSRVLRAMATPAVGYLDPYLFSRMDEIQQLLRSLFGTQNEVTLPLSATGGAGMEATFVNLLEAGDQVVVFVNGFFGGRMCEIAARLGCDLTRVDVEWGRAVPVEQVEAALEGRSPKVVAVIHAETSTGACTPLQDIAKIVHEKGALFLVDCVTSLGGMRVSVDDTGIDAIYSGSQKCLSCPPGLSPVSFGPAAMDAMRTRKARVPNWYLDMAMLADYWGPARKYHHTPPVNMLYGFHEGLRIVFEEGPEPRFARHLLNHEALVAGVEAMGLEMLVPKGERLPMLNAVRIPKGADDKKVRGTLLECHGIEISGGLGDLAGKVWRIGLMGMNAERDKVMAFLTCLQSVLRVQGLKTGGDVLEAALAVYER